MTVTHTTRPASPDEIAAEMDRRGAVIERLEAQILNMTFRLNSADGNRAIMKRRLDDLRGKNAALVAAAKAVSDRNGSYVGHDIIISCESHGEALRLMRELRDAIAKAEGR